MAIQGRKYTSSSSNRYGFNGKENDKETVGTGEGTQDYGFRLYNPSLGIFLSVDPMTNKFAWNSPYAFAENDVIRSIDFEGKEKYIVVKITDNSGKIVAMKISRNIANGHLVDQLITQRNPDGTRSQIQDSNGNNYNDQGVVEISYNISGVSTVSFRDKLNEFETKVNENKIKDTQIDKNIVIETPLKKENGYKNSDWETGYRLGGKSTKISSVFESSHTTYGKNGGQKIDAIYIDKSAPIFDSSLPAIKDVLDNNFSKKPI